MISGITLSALWLRLSDRKPPFPIKLDDNSKAFLWKHIAQAEDLSYYELPSPRPPLDIKYYNRYENRDNETGICQEKEVEKVSHFLFIYSCITTSIYTYLY